ncbi:unnamed protein product [Caenorhabditis auriculariae]|uniref:Uncharacterized protein n=1 Tax=Caenorhabditis auriculariae TaxID=2777116 RepID=A0A8S1HQ42_9PELO|nr:unnamed protein product [Caenorhabditis auriculariae]
MLGEMLLISLEGVNRKNPSFIHHFPSNASPKRPQSFTKNLYDSFFFSLHTSPRSKNSFRGGGGADVAQIAVRTSNQHRRAVLTSQQTTRESAKQKKRQGAYVINQHCRDTQEKGRKKGGEGAESDGLDLFLWVFSPESTFSSSF